MMRVAEIIVAFVFCSTQRSVRRLMESRISLVAILKQLFLMVAKEELVQTLTNYLLFRDIRHYFHDIISEKCNRVKSFEFLRESHGSINNWRAWRKLHVKFPENRVRPDPLEIPFKVAQTFNVRNELKDAKKKPATGKPHVYF